MNTVSNGSPEPVDGRCGAKLRRSDPPRYCLLYPVKGRKRCARFHGGTAARGIASATWKGKGYSAVLTGNLAKDWAAASDNREWLSLQHEIILTETRIRGLLRQLSPEDVLESKVLTELTDLLGKNKERHARMAKDLHQMLSLERVLAIMDRLGVLVKEHVTDRAALRAIQEGMELIVQSGGE